MAVLLLALIAGTHYGYEFLADATPGTTPAAVFYVMRGIEGTALFGIGAVWAGARGWMTLFAVCTWGAVEEAQTAVCRLARGLASPVDVERFSGLCGSWAWMLGLVIMGSVAALVAKGVRNG